MTITPYSLDTDDSPGTCAPVPGGEQEVYPLVEVEPPAWYPATPPIEVR